MDVVSGKWNSEAEGGKKWEMLRESMKETAERVLGWEKRRQPDWFQDNKKLKDLILKCNVLFKKWLRTHSDKDRQRYVTQRREVAYEVKRSKNA